MDEDTQKAGVRVQKTIHRTVKSAAPSLGLSLEGAYEQALLEWLEKHTGLKMAPGPEKPRAPEEMRRIKAMLRMMREDQKGDLASYVLHGIDRWVARQPKA